MSMDKSNAGFTELNIKKGWDSDEDNVLDDFYKPILSRAAVYKRLAGYFSSTTFAIAVREALDFIARGGIMQLVTSVRLSKQDLEAIEASLDNPEKVLEENLFSRLNEDLEEVATKCTALLGWMLSNKINGKPQLEMKIAIPVAASDDPSSIYHQKLGIFIDPVGNVISFSGSVNETGKAWLNNIENFKVFMSCGDASDREAVNFDQKQFEKFWNDLGQRTHVYDLPTAVRQHLLEMSPQSTKEFQETVQDIREYLERNKSTMVPRRLWPNQVEALQKWKENGFRGILAMATGTGKTLAALEGSRLAPTNVITLILVPTIVILEQWRDIIPKFDRSAELICCGGGNKWKDLLSLKLVRARQATVDENKPANRLYVVSTFATASSKAFGLTWKEIPPDRVQIIADEVHHLGAPEFRRCMELSSHRRLGLSATPQRQWDEPGTSTIVKHFGPTIYEYGIKQAIADGRLCHYQYHPLFAYLDPSEFRDYQDLTIEIKKEIARLQHKKKADEKTIESIGMTARLSRLLEGRARIKKKARDKIRVLDDILTKTLPKPLILFCEDQEQLDDLRTVLKKDAMSFLVYTSEQSSVQRNETLKIFRRREADVLLAIRCLDEGLDVPECPACIIVASSTSTREFIQRRGRILRLAGREKIAQMYDLVVLPADIRNPAELKIAEGLIRQELVRVKQMLEAADNEWETRNEIRNELEKYGVGQLANL
jgi:superfamily II DNA or RNA helicase